ncbi:30S ribosomal protein S3 [Candidatus Woesearchaeota archaeon]|nr:30S ribosomal protein S3 [Candidatus Woesearchaeota archaeon]
MIERKFVASNMKEFMVQEFISNTLKGAEHSHTKIQRTPLGEKVVIYSSRPGLVVGRKGQNIKQLTKALKKNFNLENPQIEISEVAIPFLDSQIMAEKIVNYLERFGTSKFKGIGHKIMSEVMKAQAMGIEILISGKIPSSRSKTWRFYQGYLKKCGDIALTGVDTAHAVAKLKTGVIGIKVSIMPPGTKLPDHIELLDEKQEIVEEVKEEAAEEVKEKPKKEEAKEKPKKAKKDEKARTKKDE